MSVERTGRRLDLALRDAHSRLERNACTFRHGESERHRLRESQLSSLDQPSVRGGEEPMQRRVRGALG